MEAQPTVWKPSSTALRERHRHDPVLERERRIIDGVVLDIELANAERPREPVGPDQRRAADLAADGRLAVQGEQLAVPPHRPGPRRDGLARQRSRDLVVVVGDLERTEVVGTEVEGFLGIMLAAQAALQTQHGLSGHRCISRCESPHQRGENEKMDRGAPVSRVAGRDAVGIDKVGSRQ